MATPKSTQPELSGVIGFFDDPHALIEATQKVREARYEKFDAFTPYPVHGLDYAQGLKRSPLPFVTLGAGLTGFGLAFVLQYWTSAVDWPLIVGGKPFHSWPAFVPIYFELTVLFAALSTVAAMFIFNGLPNLKRRIFDASLTCDRFALVIEAASGAEFKAFSESEATEFLKKVGAQEVRSVYTEGWF
ncbi:DUF3341 domain-containing protein [Bdellovibrionota bacterium FG-1]